MSLTESQVLFTKTLDQLAWRLDVTEAWGIVAIAWWLMYDGSKLVIAWQSLSFKPKLTRKNLLIKYIAGINCHCTWKQLEISCEQALQL